jgi:hypothetical protein
MTEIEKATRSMAPGAEVDARRQRSISNIIALSRNYSCVCRLFYLFPSYKHAQLFVDIGQVCLHCDICLRTMKRRHTLMALNVL